MTSASALSPEMRNALTGISDLSLNAARPETNSPPNPFSPEMRAALSGITELPLTPTPDNQSGGFKNRLSSAAHHIEDALSGVARKGGDLVKNNADIWIPGTAAFLGTFLTASVGHNLELAMSFPVLAALYGNVGIPIISLVSSTAERGIGSLVNKKIKIGSREAGPLLSSLAYDKLNNSRVKKVVGGLINAISGRAARRITFGLYTGSLIGVATAGVLDIKHQIQAAHANQPAAQPAPADNDAASGHPGGVTNQPSIPATGPDTTPSVAPPVARPPAAVQNPPTIPGVGEAGIILPASPTIIPTPEVTTLAPHLQQAVTSGDLWHQLSSLPALSGGYTQEALNFVTRIVQAKEKAGQTVSAEQLQQLINYAKSTFDGIHNSMFGGKPFDLDVYRTMHQGIVNALPEAQKHAFNLADLPLNTPLDVVLKDKALQFFMTNPIPVAP